MTRPYGEHTDAVLSELYRQLNAAEARRDAAEKEIADLQERIDELEPGEPAGFSAVYAVRKI